MIAARVGIAAAHAERVLRGQHQLLAPAVDELGEQLFRAAIPIEVRGIDAVAAAFEIVIEDLTGIPVLGSPPALPNPEVHGTQRQWREPQARTAEETIMI